MNTIGRKMAYSIELNSILVFITALYYLIFCYQSHINMGDNQLIPLKKKTLLIRYAVNTIPNNHVCDCWGKE